jgi:two-component system KDP operon response regulator KdpE
VNKPDANADGSTAAMLSAEYDVLIVDDDQPVARALGALMREAGFRTTVLYTGKEAIRHAGAEHVSAVIIDVHLPDLNGLIVSINLREQLGEAVPIFIVSGDTSMETINSLAFAGATYFFAKPMSPAYVIERLRDCLEKTEGLGKAEG